MDGIENPSRRFVIGAPVDRGHGRAGDDRGGLGGVPPEPQDADSEPPSDPFDEPRPEGAPSEPPSGPSIGR